MGTPASRAMMRNWMKHLPVFIHTVDFVHMTPVRDFCTQVPTATIAVTLANPGKEYVIYVADKREKDERGQGEPCRGPLAFPLPTRRYEARLYTPASGQYAGEVRQLDGGDVSLVLEPFRHDIVLHITAAA